MPHVPTIYQLSRFILNFCIFYHCLLFTYLSFFTLALSIALFYLFFVRSILYIFWSTFFIALSAF